MQISFLISLPLIEGEVRFMFGLLTFEIQSWLEGGHSFSFISTPSKEQLASDGPDIVQLGSFLLLGHF